MYGGEKGEEGLTQGHFESIMSVEAVRPQPTVRPSQAKPSQTKPPRNGKFTSAWGVR